MTATLSIGVLARWFCLRGWHAWIYTDRGTHRRCVRCQVEQSQVMYRNGSTEWM